jgi:hypothetical protein
MARVIYSSLLGAILGGLILAMVAGFGTDAAVTVPMPQANGGVHNETISVGGIVSKLAIIFGVCTGAMVGALAGAAGSRESLAESAGKRQRGFQ